MMRKEEYMFIKKATKKTILAILCLLLCVCVASEYKKHKIYAAIIPNARYEQSGYVYEEYYVFQHVDNNSMVEKSEKEYEQLYSIDLENVHSVIVSLSNEENICCDANQGRTAFNHIVTVRGNNTYTGYDYCEIKDNGVGWGVGTISLHQMLTTSPKCTSCGRIGYFKAVDSKLIVERNVPCIVTNPSDRVVNVGSQIQFRAAARFAKQYKWQIENNGEFIDLSDGCDAYGNEYYGSDTELLTVKPQVPCNNVKYRCVITGVASSKRITGEAKLTANAIAVLPSTTPSTTKEPTPAVTPTPSKTPTPVVTSVPTLTPTPSPGPTTLPAVTPAPTLSPTATPIPTVTPYVGPTVVPPAPVTPYPNQPGQSSSSFIARTTSSSSGKSSSSSNTSSTSSSSGYGGIIGTDTPDDKSPGKSLPERPYYSSSSSFHRPSYYRSDTYVSHTDSSVKTVIKDGILYIVDDEEMSLEPITGHVDSLEEEQFEIENSYSESDLIKNEELKKLEKKKERGSLYTAGIAGLIVLLILLVLFVLFFMVIVEGECEEHDDVFDLYAVKLLYRRKGKWCVNIGEAFDENAVVRITYGLLFAMIFRESEIVFLTNGSSEGMVLEYVEQKMLIHRKKIRRRGNEND